MTDRPSLHDIREWPTTPAERIRAQRVAALSYGEFVEALERAIDYISSEMCKNPQLFQNQSEDQITFQLVLSLTMLGFLASFEKTVGGHCDIVVEWDDVGLWLGEAKIFSGDYGWLYSGFQQLCTRYSTGSPSQSCGGLLVYMRVARSKEIMQKWKERLERERVGILISACRRDALAFKSEHTNERTDTPLSIRHKPLSFFFEPMDRKKSSVNATKPRKKNK